MKTSLIHILLSIVIVSCSQRNENQEPEKEELKETVTLNSPEQKEFTDYRVYTDQADKAFNLQYSFLPNRTTKIPLNIGAGVPDTLKIEQYEARIILYDNNQISFDSVFDKWDFEQFISDTNFLKLATLSQVEFVGYNDSLQILTFNFFMVFPESDYAYSFDLDIDNRNRITVKNKPLEN